MMPLIAPRSARSKAGRQLTAGPYTYVILALVTIAAVFPLYYTLIIASHTNHEMAQTPPPFIPNASVFHNIRLALHEQPLFKAIVNTDRKSTRLNSSHL